MKSVKCPACSANNYFNVSPDMLEFVSKGICWQCHSKFSMHEERRFFRYTKYPEQTQRTKPFLTAADLVLLREMRIGL